MPSCMLPLETKEIILKFLAEDDDDDHSALKACSLVCQAFLPICRKHIFGTICLDAVAPHTTRAFGRLLRERPEIADYIRRLDTIDIAELIGPSIQESLKRISRLKFLTVRYRGRRGHHSTLGFDWSDNPIRPILLHLLHLPTLLQFKVENLRNFVVSDLIPCVNLKHLHIGPHTTVVAKTTFPAALPEHSIRLNEFVAKIGTGDVVTKLCKAQRPDGQPLIDFGSLSKITMFLEKSNEGEAAQELFRRCQTLTSVRLSFWDPENVRPSLADMLRPSMQTLKHIVVIVHVDDVDNDPLFGIPSELEGMRTKNIIESITIRVMVLTDADARRGDDWGRLDEVLTTPGWFALKRVSLTIEVCSFSRTDNELEMALRRLPETQFPRLSTSNSISFHFQVDAVLV